MSAKYSVIYVPGLGDSNLTTRQKLLNTWHYRNVTVEICSMHWTVAEDWPLKLKRLTERVTQLHNKGHVVTIVGESAGAAAVVQALAAVPEALHGVVLLCGKSQYPERVAQRRFHQNPAFYEAIVGSDHIVKQLSDSQKIKILNLHPLFDPVVPVAETKIIGTRDSYMPIIGHAASIAFATTLWSWRIIRYAKKLR